MSQRNDNARLRRIAEAVEEELGTASICIRCNATLGTFSDTCPAALDDRCPGFERIESVRSRKIQQMRGQP